jgi:GDP-L-fucose synthase
MKVALLGASGFVGSNVCELLEAKGIEVYPASRSVGVDLRNLTATTHFFKKITPNFVINCAAHVGSLNYVTKQAADVIVDNTKMLISVYQAVAAVCPEAIIINPIANCAYPAKADTYDEDYWWDGHLHRSVLSYGATRRHLWAVSECFSMQHGVRTISLLVPNMYGPHDSTNPDKAHALNAIAAKFVKSNYINSRALEIWGTGVAIREWLYAPDFARIIAEILENPNLRGLNEPLNIAQNFGLSVRELVDIIKSHFDDSILIKYDSSRPDGAPKKVMKDVRFRKIFPQFQFTSFDEGLRKTLEYYESILPY